MRLIRLKNKWLAIVGLLIVSSAILWPRLNIKEISLSIRIQYANLPEGLVVIAPPTRAIEVVVRGPKSKIKEILKNSTLIYELDLSGAEIGMNAFPVQLEEIVLPSGVRVLHTNLSLIIVKVDKLIQKELPVRVVLSGKPGPGYMIADSVVEPSQVKLTGPQTILGPLTEAKTKPIEINGVKDSINKKGMLDLPEDVHAVLPENTINAHIYIEEKIIIKSFNQIKINGRDTAYRYEVTPATLDLSVRGPQNLVDKLSPENGLDVFIDLKDIKPGVYVRYAVIKVPVGITLVSVKPEIYTVAVSKEELQ